MVDLTGRPAGPRRAVAEAEVAVSQEALSAIIDGATPKGDVLAAAELAGVMAAKRAPELIPLCHPVALTDLLVRASPDRAAASVRIHAEAAAFASSGVEMEALTAAAIAALTVCDMVADRELAAAVRDLRLVSSSGGEMGEWRRADERPAEGRVPPGARAAGRVARGSHGPGPAGGKRRSP
jgi:cyclic pyranopterin phosphate synthase